MNSHENLVPAEGYRHVKMHPEARVALIRHRNRRRRVGARRHRATRRPRSEPITANGSSSARAATCRRGCSLHVDAGFPLTVGRNVIIGHNATVHGCTVEDSVLIGMGAIVMNGVHVGKEALIGAGALVPEGREVPPRAVMVGVPAKQIRTLTDEEVAQNAADAALYVEIGKQMERDGIAAAGANMPR